MPRAFVGSDGHIYKACPQCIKDEMAVYPNLLRDEAEVRVARRADETFCASSSTADGYQAWCKYHVNLKSRSYQKRRAAESTPEEKRARQERARRAALRRQSELRQLQAAVREKLGLAPAGDPEDKLPTTEHFRVADPPTQDPSEVGAVGPQGAVPPHIMDKVQEEPPDLVPEQEPEEDSGPGFLEIIPYDDDDDDEFTIEEAPDLKLRREKGEQLLDPPEGLQ